MMNPGALKSRLSSNFHQNSASILKTSKRKIQAVLQNVCKLFVVASLGGAVLLVGERLICLKTIQYS